MYYKIYTIKKRCVILIIWIRTHTSDYWALGGVGGGRGGAEPPLVVQYGAPSSRCSVVTNSSPGGGAVMAAPTPFLPFFTSNEEACLAPGGAARVVSVATPAAFVALLQSGGQFAATVHRGRGDRSVSLHKCALLA
jgi:hypothetical protein